MAQRNRAEPSGAMAPDAVASIVVLPSKILAQASDQFLTDAIPNTISAHLTQVKGLETRVPPSSVEVERVVGDLMRLADAYGVSAFVLSSLTAEADRLVLNVQLVDARSRRLLGASDFEGRREGYLTLGARRRGGAAQRRQTGGDARDGEAGNDQLGGGARIPARACIISTATTISTTRPTSIRRWRPSRRR